MIISLLKSGLEYSMENFQKFLYQVMLSYQVCIYTWGKKHYLITKQQVICKMSKGAVESKPDTNILVTELQHYSWAYKDEIVEKQKTTLIFQILNKDCFEDGWKF